MFKFVLDKQAEKDLQKILKSPLKNQLYKILDVMEKDPFAPPYEKLLGDFKGAYSRRINLQHRLVYMVLEEEKTVKIISMWGHYDDN